LSIKIVKPRMHPYFIFVNVAPITICDS